MRETAARCVFPTFSLFVRTGNYKDVHEIQQHVLFLGALYPSLHPVTSYKILRFLI